MYNKGIITQMFQDYSNYNELEDMVMRYKDDGGSILIFDDQLGDINEDICKIFHQLSHHGNCSTFFLSQNLFYANKSYRSMSLNAHYLFVMKNTRDRSQIVNLAKQFSPYK